MAGLLQTPFAWGFKGMSETQIDNTLASWELSHCVKNTGQLVSPTVAVTGDQRIRIVEPGGIFYDAAMSDNFAILDSRPTPLGELMLRRRRLQMLDGLEVFEVKLGDSFLMSSLFHDVEVALANLGLAPLAGVDKLDVVVGGLGLGYTAVAALKHPSVQSLLVVEALDAVIDWHNQGLVPLGATLTGDARCRFIQGDFFALAAAPQPGFDPAQPGRRFHAVLLDIDHSPRKLLHPRNAAFYQPAGLRRLAAHLDPGGVFALWSDDPPDAEFLQHLNQVFVNSQAHIVKFHNPLLDCDSASTVYVARKAAEK